MRSYLDKYLLLVISDTSKWIAIYLLQDGKYERYKNNPIFMLHKFYLLIITY